MAATEVFRVRFGDSGRLVLPAEIRKRLKLRQGDQLLLSVEPDGSVQMRSADKAIRKTRGLYRAQARHRSLVDELIADRRREARRDSSPR